MFGNTGGSSLFGNAGGGGFGANTGQSSGGLFGKSDAQVQQQAGSGLFGGGNTQNSSLWGNNSTNNNQGGSLFGGTNPQQQQNTNGVGLFGGSNNNNLNTSTVFGNSSFGQTNTSNQGGLFGNQNKQGGNSPGIFGANQQQTGGIFGGGQQANTGGGLFGNQGNQANQSGGLFGQQNQPSGGSLFGNSQQPSFGMQQNNQQKSGFGGSSLFGANTNQQASGGIFGNNQQSQPNSGGIFGSQPQNTGGIFGGANQSQGGLFGQSNLQNPQQQNNLNQSTIFGQANPPSSFSLGNDNKASTLGGASWGVNTNQPQVKGKFTAVKSKNPKIDSKHLVKCIVCLDQSFSKNQYRLRYLFNGDAGPTSQQNQNSGWSGQAQTTSSWGAQQNQSNLWGATTASSTNTNKPVGTSLFGNSNNTGFGTNNTTSGNTGGLFGVGSSSGGIFGGNNVQQNNTNQGGGNLFGTFSGGPNTSNNQWNSPTLNKSAGGLFNASTNQNTGSTLFGGTQNTTNTGGGLFGTQNAGNAGGGLFGAQNAGNAGGGLFGGQNTANAGGGLFGAQNTGGGGSLFGTQNNTNTGGGLFGTQNVGNAGGGLFGAQNAGNTGGGLFGAQNAGNAGGGLFGAQSAGNTGGGLFGAQNTGSNGGMFGGQNTANAGGGLFGAQNIGGGGGSLFGGQNTGGSLFGGTPSGPLFGNQNPGNNFNQQSTSALFGASQQQFTQFQNQGYPQNVQNLFMAGLQPLVNNQNSQNPNQDNSQLLNAILALPTLLSAMNSNPNLMNMLKGLVPNMTPNFENSLLLPSRDPFSNFYDQNVYKSKIAQNPTSTLFTNESFLQQQNQKELIQEYKRKKLFIDQMNVDTPLFNSNSFKPQEVIKRNNLETPFNLLMQNLKSNITDKSASLQTSESPRITTKQQAHKTFYTDFRTIPQIDRLSINRNQKQQPQIRVIKEDQKYLNKGVDMSKYKHRMNAKPHHIQNYRKENHVSLAELPLESNFKLKPSIKDLQELTQEQIKRVNNVQISNQFGKIRFIGPINLYRKYLFKCIKIQQDCIEILIPQWQNKPCYLTYYNFGNYKQKSQEQKRKIVKKMRKWIAKNKLKLEDFNENTGTLQVKVDAFMTDGKV